MASARRKNRDGAATGLAGSGAGWRYRFATPITLGAWVLAGRDPALYARYLATGWRGSVYVSPLPPPLAEGLEPGAVTFVLVCRQYRGGSPTGRLMRAAGRAAQHAADRVMRDLACRDDDGDGEP